MVCFHLIFIKKEFVTGDTSVTYLVLFLSVTVTFWFDFSQQIELWIVNMFLGNMFSLGFPVYDLYFKGWID